MESLKNKWSLLMTNAVIAIIAGIIFVFVPQESIATLGFAAGIIILISGLFLVFGAFSHAQQGKNMFFWLLEGLINLSVGIVLIINPEWLIQFILILIGLWSIILGVFQLYTGFVNSKNINNNGLLKLNGLAFTVIGLLLLFKPEMVAGIVVQILGIISILIGGVMMYFAFLIKRIKNEVEKEQVFEEVEELADETKENDSEHHL